MTAQRLQYVIEFRLKLYLHCFSLYANTITSGIVKLTCKALYDISWLPGEIKSSEFWECSRGGHVEAPHNNALISGTQEPQLVPAFRQRPTS